MGWIVLSLPNTGIEFLNQTNITVIISHSKEMCLLVEKRWSIFGSQCFGRHPAPAYRRPPRLTLISLPGTEPSSEPTKAHRFVGEK